MMETSDFNIAKDFLNFMVDYYAMTRRHEIESNEYRANSHSFSMLYALRKYQNQSITMTRFADEMGITKQQLTKLVNDLESKEYVVRTHNRENRRQVYISITEQGIAYLETMIGELIHEVMRVMTYYSTEDKELMGTCVRALSDLFRRDAEICRCEREKKNAL